MTDKKPDNPRIIEPGSLAPCWSTITLRDIFAAAAMQGRVAAADPLMSINMQNMAQAAYEMADAMLEAREVREGE